MKYRQALAAVVLVAILFVHHMIPFAQDGQNQSMPDDDHSVKDAMQELPKISLELTSLDESEYLMYAGIDIGIWEEQDAAAGDPEDKNGDGKIYRIKQGKIKRFLTRSKSITVDLGKEEDYRRGIRHKIAIRTLYIPAAGGEELIIAQQDNGKDGWVMLPDSEFMLSFFDDIGGEMVTHTEKWEENRIRYNKVKAGEETEYDEENKTGENEATQKTAGNVTKEIRPPHMFWSGEMLMLTVQTKERVCGEGEEGCTGRCGIEVALYEKKDGIWESPYPAVLIEEYEEEQVLGETNTKMYTYHGNLWNEDMINKWGNEKPETLLITATPVIGGEAVTGDRKEETIIMDNRDLFFRIYRKMGASVMT